MQSTTKQTLKIYWEHSKRYKLHMFFIALGLIVAMGAELITPFFYRGLLNYVANGDRSSIHEPLMLLLFVGISSLTYSTAWRFLIHINNRFQGKTKGDLYRTCYNYVMNHSAGFF